jgi:D-alanyl-D-alanine carboxypeptidase (penicillin-binding protein 5/6)
MDAENKNVLYEKSGYKKLYPASTTKILTAILALENLDLNKTIVVSKNAIYSTPIGSSVIYLKEGEVISLRNVLYGLLVKSGNDAANVLAENVSGNVDGFVKLMNEKLKEIGCNNTHFTNPHGFHDENHYSTAYDMAILMQYAMQNETFKKIVETKYIEIDATNKTPTRKYYNTAKMFFDGYKNMYYEYLLGGKTGYTEEARGTFVGYAKKDDRLVIVSVFDGSQSVLVNKVKNEARFLDAKATFEYSFDNFNKEKILNKDDYTFKIRDENIKKEYTIGLSEDIYALIKNDENISEIINNITYSLNIDFNKLSNQSLQNNDLVGNVSINISGNSINTSNIYNLSFISETDYFPIDYYINKYMLIVPLILLILIFLILFIILLKGNNKNSSLNYYDSKSRKKRNSFRK